MQDSGRLPQEWVFYIKFAGIAPGMTADVLNAAREFFALPEARKNAISKEYSRAGRGTKN